MELGCVDYASMKHVKRHVPTRYINSGERAIEATPPL